MARKKFEYTAVPDKDMEAFEEQYDKVFEAAKKNDYFLAAICSMWLQLLYFSARNAHCDAIKHLKSYVGSEIMDAETKARECGKAIIFDKAVDDGMDNVNEGTIE